jgi:hypothetical protein
MLAANSPSANAQTAAAGAIHGRQLLPPGGSSDVGFSVIADQG